MLFFDSSDPKAWKFQKIELSPSIDNADENVTKCYFYILSFPEQKKIRGKWYYVTKKLHHYHGNMFFLKFQSIILKNQQDIDQNVFLLVFEMS